MTSAIRYPPATWKGDGEDAGAYISGVPWRVVLHTTETEGVPGYDGGGSAPHLTYNPRNRSWTQHTDIGVAARALKNLSGGVETNRARAVQVEMVCYSDKGIADDQPSERIWVGALPDTAYEDLRAFLEWTYAEFGVEDRWPGVQAFSYSQAAAAGFRFTPSEWEAWDGVCGHQHVTENDHWDPGALEWDKLIGGDMALSDDDLKKIRGLIVEVIGGDRVSWTPEGDTRTRVGNQGILDAVWHSMSYGRKMLLTLEETHDAALDAAAGGGGGGGGSYATADHVHEQGGPTGPPDDRR